MDKVRMKTRNGKVLFFNNGIWYTEEAFAALCPREYAQVCEVCYA